MQKSLPFWRGCQRKFKSCWELEESRKIIGAPPLVVVGRWCGVTTGMVTTASLQWLSPFADGCMRFRGEGVVCGPVIPLDTNFHAKITNNYSNSPRTSSVTGCGALAKVRRHSSSRFVFDSGCPSSRLRVCFTRQEAGQGKLWWLNRLSDFHHLQGSASVSSDP